jgi:hypothetical protein
MHELSTTVQPASDDAVVRAETTTTKEAAISLWPAAAFTVNREYVHTSYLGHSHYTK